MADNVTVIGPGSVIKGDMAFDNAARIQGTFEGTISAKTDLHIGDTGSCKADLTANTVQIDGSVEGDVVAHESLQLGAKARLVGNITAGTLVVVQGATFIGHCRVGAGAESIAPANPRPETPAQPRPRPGTNNSARATPVPTVTADLEATLAGLETKLASMGKPRPAAAPQA
ncbi:MAG: polymer-forming cytoskeletal protein [Phycisphaeraceae bacterium]|nr:polymer-forming cytoskeletal protein [Phycisphaeraceae bacterium]